MKDYDYYFKKYGIGLTSIDNSTEIFIHTATVNIRKWDPTEDTWIHHNLDGPSTIYVSGQKFWYFHDTPVASYDFRKINGYKEPIWTGEFYDWTVEQGMDIDNLTDEDIDLIKLTWG